MQAIFDGRSETLNRSTLRAPLSPAISRRHDSSTPQPSGVTMPNPVTTTRLMSPSRFGLQSVALSKASPIAIVSTLAPLPVLGRAAASDRFDLAGPSLLKHFRDL